jgi:hypothetical protein
MSDLRKKKASPAIATVEDLALAWDITPRQVQNLAVDGIIPKPSKRGEYNWRLCTKAYIEKLRQDAKKTPIQTKLELEKLREIVQNNDDKEFEMAKKQGAFIPLKIVEDFYDSVVPQWKAKIESIGSRLKNYMAQQPEPEKIPAYVDACTNEILQELGSTRVGDYINPQEVEAAIAESENSVQ